MSPFKTYIVCIINKLLCNNFFLIYLAKNRKPTLTQKIPSSMQTLSGVDYSSVLRDKTRRVSILRVTVQLIFLFLIFYESVVSTWKSVLLSLILGITFLSGRFFCGWICPLGLYMDTVTLLRKKLRIRHWTLSERLNLGLHKFGTLSHWLFSVCSARICSGHCHVAWCWKVYWVTRTIFSSCHFFGSTSTTNLTLEGAFWSFSWNKRV